MVRTRRLCSRFGEDHRAFLAKEIDRLLPIARDPRNPMARIARFLIDSLLWCWTADGVDSDGNAVRDGLKYDLRHQRHTTQALELWEANGRRGSGLRHEHAVPKTVLLKHLLTLEDATPSLVGKTLERFCFAIIVSRSEDDLLNERGYRETMPPDWSFAAADCDPLARYVACDLGTSVRDPLTPSAAAG